jgi:hypothetical protein
MLKTFRPGMDRALWLTGLTSGALKRRAGLYILFSVGEEKLLNLVDSFQSFQKYPEPKFVTAEAQVTRGWTANSTQTPVGAPIDIPQPAVSLANISWQGKMTRLNFSGSPRTGEVPPNIQANVVSPRVIPCDHRDSGRELKIVV